MPREVEPATSGHARMFVSLSGVAADDEGLVSPGTVSGVPMLTLVAGEGIAADDLAWLSLAEAAERALLLPALSTPCASRMVEMAAACRSAAGQPPPHERSAPAFVPGRAPA